MGIFRRAWALFTGASETFSESAPRPIDQVIYQMTGGADSPTVSRTAALSVPAVQRGRNLICSISTLPLEQRGPDLRIVRNPLLEQIDPDVPNVVTLAQTIEDLLFEGTSWWRITAFAADGYPVYARHLDHSSVSLNPPIGRAPAPLPSGIDPRGKRVVWVDGHELAATLVIRFDSPNPALLRVGGRAIRRAMLLDRAAAMYADDPRPADFFTPAEGADPVDDDDVKALLAEWRVARKARSTAYVPAALKYNTVDTPTPVDLQLVDLQRQATLDIANLLGLDPEDLGVSTTSRTYQNATDRRQDRINDVLSPYMRAITDRLGMGDVTKRGFMVNFRLDDYMRADPLTRWSVYEKAVAMQAMTVEEVRADERRAALPPGAFPAPAPAAPAAPEPAAPRVDHGLAAVLQRTITFDGDRVAFTADIPVARFSVDVGQRIIAGLALPYGRIAVRNGNRFRFAASSLRWSDLRRVKLLRDHDYSQAVGHAIQLTETPDGVQMQFRVARGIEGDRVLALAEDGVLDGLSVGVDFERVADDPENAGVHLVHLAALREVSITAMPAFDDARVTSLAASRDPEGDAMPCTTCGQMHAVGAACQTAPLAPPATFVATLPPAPAPAPVAPAGPTPQQMAAAFQAMGWTPPTAAPVVAPAVVPDVRQVVDPTRGPAALVRDPVPYTFDRIGNLQPGSHEFSSDLFNGIERGDTAAYQRALTFVSEQFVITTDVDELNPTRQRPDMYVDQRAFRYPVWESINKGTLPDITPFTFPKFSSASGLVAAHVEGTEPSLGTFVATGQTVTPSAVSGKVKLSRETWDQGGNPQVGALIWRRMEAAWYEALEASAVAVLDAATPTGITFTTGGGTTGQTLDSEITAAFAALQYIRGGFTMDVGFAQIDLYKALIAAKDTTGRRLYPALGPMNAVGTVTSRFAALDVNGVLFYPAWALAATGVVAASSYLFDRDSVHGWATVPNRIDIDKTEVANVYIGLWGYKATAISDINGVRELIYDPV